MRTDMRLVLLIGSSLLISGCQLFQGNSTRLQAGLRIPAQAEPHEYARQQFEAGRAALASHNYASAVAAFRNSGLEPEYAAGSYNGLAIAYAGIGRNDLAERYFRMAVAADPGSPRYANNLARLEQANLERNQARLAQEQRSQDEAQARALRILPGSGARARLEVTTPPSRIVRASTSAVEVGRAPVPLAPPAARAVLPARPIADAARPVPVLPAVRLPQPVKAVATRDEPVGPRLQRGPSGVSLTTAAPQPRPASPRTEPRVAVNEPIKTTGRRYSPGQFAEIFAPYDRSDAQTPIMASVTSPGLRSAAPLHPQTSPVLPHPQFGTALADAADSGTVLAAQ